MTLREYMERHAGECLLADSTVPVQPDQLDPAWADGQVDVYSVGRLPDGRAKFHLYTLNPRRYVLTYIETSSEGGSENPQQHI